MTLPRLIRLIGTLLFSLGAVRAEFSPEKLALVDRPFQGLQVALAPDGRHLAHTKYEGDKLWLVITDLDAKTSKVLPLDSAERHGGTLPQLETLRWVAADRLVLVGAEGQIMSVDAGTGRSIQLWAKDDDGIVQNSNFKSEPYLVVAGTPRLLPPLADDPNHVLIESVATMGPESFSNAYRVDVRTGASELVADRDYLRGQVALYGRGDMLLWPPWPTMEYIDPFTGQPRRFLPTTIEQVQAALGIASLMITVIPDIDIIRDKNLSRATLRSTPFAARLKIEEAMFWREDTMPLDPYTGGAVSPDSSAGGRMIYDRQGWPRLLYTEYSDGSAREFRYAKPGQFPFEPDTRFPGLDKVLGQPKGKEFTVSAANYFGERSYPIAFDFDPNVLYYASNVGRDTYGIYSLNLLTKEPKELAPDLKGVDLAPHDPIDVDQVLVFDEARKVLAGIRYTSLRPRTYWLDRELAELQAKLEREFPRHGVEILGWDAERRRFVLRVSAEDDPGAIFLHEPASGRTEKLFSATPWLAETKLNAGGAFAFRTPAGVDLSGYLTLPDEPKISPPPLFVYLQSDLWNRAAPGFSAEAEMFADMGFVVMRLNYRGSPGFGRSHFDAIKDGIGVAPAADVLAALDWLGAWTRFDRKRVVIAGEGFGGYVALQVAARNPADFRAVIGINAPTSLSAWTSWQQIKETHPMYRSGAVESGTTVDFRSEVRRRFVAQIKEERAPATSATTAPAPAALVVESAGSGEVTPLASLLASVGIGGGRLNVERVRLSGDFRTGPVETRRKAFERIDEFLNEHLYNYGTSFGPLRVLETPPESGTQKP